MSSVGVEGKVVIITGASSGIGEAAAIELAKCGAKLVLAARRVERLDALVARAQALGAEALAVGTDVTSREQVEAMVAAAIERFGRVDVLVNNAGVMLLSFMKNAMVEQWDQMIDVNIKGPLYGIAAVLPHMRAQGSGHIINVSSMAGRRVIPSGAVYSGTKFALHAISMGLRQELAPTDNIRTTILSPGIVDTELTDHITDPDAQPLVDRINKLVPLTGEDVGRAIAYAIAQPEHVDVFEIAMLPTKQG